MQSGINFSDFFFIQHCLVYFIGVYMEQIWQWGIDVIIVIQKIRSPFFDYLFLFISFFGTQLFYMILLPLLYWCYDKKYASRILIIFLISGWLNTVMKYLINHPRPYSLNESVKIGTTGGPGIPSGHAQQSLVVLVSISLWLKNRIFTLASVLIILLIALSRVYLGVHFPTDVFGGWFLGALVMMVLWPLFDRVENFLCGISPLIQASSVIVLPALLSFILASKSSVLCMGALSGFTMGRILEKRFINFGSSESFKSCILRFITGVIVMMLIYSTEKFLYSRSISYYLVIVFIHSSILGLWISAGAPVLFKKYRI